MLLSSKLVAQNEFQNNVVPPSPEAASLGKYVEIPISYFTGTPEISVPIHEISVRDFSMPISISYHASGIKVDDVASNVGLGWTLNAGGSITTTVMGEPDLASSGGISLPSGSLEDFNPTWSFVDDTDYNWADDATSNGWDTQFDIFYYTLPGRGGKFVINKDGDEVIPIPYNALDITATTPMSITDENGVKFSFGVTESTQITQNPSSGGSNPSFSSTFYVSAIETPMGSKITFEYESNTYAYDQSRNELDYVHETGCPTKSADDVDARMEASIAGKRIKRIKVTEEGSLGEVIEFDYDETAASFERKDIGIEGGTGNHDSRRLKGIRVRYGAEIVKEFVLTHSYFETTAYNGSMTKYQKALNTRLKLESIQEVGKPAFEFTYNTTDKLPARLSYAQDHYGYFNGKTSNTTLIPSSHGTQPSYSGGADRSIDATKAQADILTKIDYPTGGYTEFTYEGHSESTTKAGGLRIKTVKQYAESGTVALEKHYEYSGLSDNSDFDYHSLYQEFDPGSSPLNLCDYELYSSASVPTLGLAAPYKIGYSTVKVLHGDATGTLGRTTYEYYTHINQIKSTHAYYGDEISYDWARGMLKKVTEEKKISSGFQIVKETTSQYEIETENAARWDFDNTTNNNIATNEHHIVGLRLNKISEEDKGSNGIKNIYDVGIPRVVSNWQYLEKKTEKIYESGTSPQSQTLETTYVYDEQDVQVESETVKNSDGLDYKTVYKRPEDYTAAPYPDMKTANRLLTVVEEQLWIDDGVDDKLVKSKVTDHYTTDLRWPSNLYALEVSDPISSPGEVASDATWGNDFYQIEGYNFSTDGRFREVLQYGNGLRTSYLWGLDQHHLTAEIVNAGWAQVAYTSFEDEYWGEWDHPGGVTTAQSTFESCLETLTGGGSLKDQTLLNSCLTTYQNSLDDVILYDFTEAKTGSRSYKDTDAIVKSSVQSGDYVVTLWAKGTGNVTVKIGTSAQGSKAVTSEWALYSWDLELTTSSDIKVELSATTVNIDELRLYPKGARMTTYTYEPGVGISAIGDPNNIFSYFDYDDVGRLKLMLDQDSNILKYIKYKYQD